MPTARRRDLLERQPWLRHLPWHAWTVRLAGTPVRLGDLGGWLAGQRSGADVPLDQPATES